jgi:hypothetical protein
MTAAITSSKVLGNPPTPARILGSLGLRHPERSRFSGGARDLARTGKNSRETPIRLPLACSRFAQGRLSARW